MVPAVPDKISPERLSQASGLCVEKRRYPHPGSLHLSVDGGCACSLMSADSDADADTWNLDPCVLEGLARALRLLNQEAGGFTFQASWIGDKPQTQTRTPLRELLSDVADNQIRNKHVYIVGKASGN